MFEINGKKAKIRFGASALVRLGRMLKVKTIDDVLTVVSKLDFNKLRLDDIEVIANIILAGLLNADENALGISDKDIQDAIFTESESVGKAMELFAYSIDTDSVAESKGEKKK